MEENRMLAAVASTIERQFFADEDKRLLESWKKYIQGIWPTLNDDERRQMRKTTLDRALAVAESAGGFLGLTSKVSASERAVIEELENVLRVF